MVLSHQSWLHKRHETVFLFVPPHAGKRKSAKKRDLDSLYDSLNSNRLKICIFSRFVTSQCGLLSSLT